MFSFEFLLILSVYFANSSRGSVAAHVLAIKNVNVYSILT
jgi:hypothetical protein